MVYSIVFRTRAEFLTIELLRVSISFEGNDTNEFYFNKRREKELKWKRIRFWILCIFYRLWVLFVFIKKIEESSLTFVWIWYIWMMNFLFVSNIFDIKIRLILKRKRKLVVFSLVEYYFFKLLSLWFDHLISRFFC